jgi:hypothetical protein
LQHLSDLTVLGHAGHLYLPARQTPRTNRPRVEDQ